MNGKGIHSYRATIRAHRLLLSLPPIIAMVIAGVIVFSAPKQYKSSADLWVNNPPVVGSSQLPSQTTGNTNPSSQEATVLTELLSTQSFTTAVGNHSLLAAYLKSNGGSSQLEQSILKNLQAGVSTNTPGINELKISYTGATPEVAASVVNGLVSELQKSTVSLGTSYARAQVKYYTAQSAAAKQALASADAQATQYKNAHPTATVNNSPEYQSLVTAVQNDSSALATANSNIAQSQSATNAGADTPVILVQDAAQLPTGPTAGKKKLVEGIVGGMVAGLLLSLLAVVLLTPARPDELDDELLPVSIDGNSRDAIRRTAIAAETTTSKPLELRVSQSEEWRTTSLPRLPKSGS